MIELDDLRKEVVKCVGCGMCRQYCPTLDIMEWDNFGPRGRIIIIREILNGNLQLNKTVIDSIFSCVLCEHCSIVCPSLVNVGEIVRKMRTKLIKLKKSKD